MASRVFIKTIALLGVLPSFVLSDPAASTLYLPQKQTAFSLNIASDSNDTYFHFEFPAQHSWVAVGAGTEMKGALMFFMYPSKDNKRSGTVEPTFSKEIQVEALQGSGIQNGKMTLNAVCHNCRSWNGGSLDISSDTQPWMYAFGPTSNPVTSNSASADLTQHSTYGKFTMNMTQATGPGGVPTASLITSGVALEGKQLIKDGDNLSLTHGYAMAALVLVFTPILALHLLTGARLRWMNYTLFTLVAVVGLVCGFYDSMSYNRSKDFTSPHQIIGIVAVVGLILLAVFRILSHRKNHAENNENARAGRWIWPVVWVLALVDGFVGIKLADAKYYIYIIYSASIIAMILVAGPLMWLVKKRHERRERSKFVNGGGTVSRY